MRVPTVILYDFEPITMLTLVASAHSTAYTARRGTVFIPCTRVDFLLGLVATFECYSGPCSLRERPARSHGAHLEIASPAIGSSTWSTWSAVSNLTPRTGELRSAPSWPDARHRVAGKRALALGGARSQGHNTGLRGLAPRTRFPLNHWEFCCKI